MEANEYQRWTETTAVYPAKKELEYLTLGLVGEAGEVAEKVKKLIRDGKNTRSLEWESAVLRELGDVAWYLARLTDHLDYSMTDLFDMNVQKLNDRKYREKLHGSGDNR